MCVHMYIHIYGRTHIYIYIYTYDMDTYVCKNTEACVWSTTSVRCSTPRSSRTTSSSLSRTAWWVLGVVEGGRQEAGGGNKAEIQIVETTVKRLLIYALFQTVSSRNVEVQKPEHHNLYKPLVTAPELLAAWSLPFIPQDARIEHQVQPRNQSTRRQAARQRAVEEGPGNFAKLRRQEANSQNTSTATIDTPKQPRPLKPQNPRDCERGIPGTWCRS